MTAISGLYRLLADIRAGECRVKKVEPGAWVVIAPDGESVAVEEGEDGGLLGEEWAADAVRIAEGTTEGEE